MTMTGSFYAVLFPLLIAIISIALALPAIGH